MPGARSQGCSPEDGRAELDEHALGVNTSEMEVPYELKERSKDEVMADLRHRLGTCRV